MYLCVYLFYFLITLADRPYLQENNGSQLVYFQSWKYLIAQCNACIIYFVGTQFQIIFLLGEALRSEGGALMYNVVSRCDQEHYELKWLFFEIMYARSMFKGQNRQFSTKRVHFTKSVRFYLVA